MNFNRDQIVLLSKYLSDMSKILFVSTLLGFVVPTNAALITFPIFILGALIATGCLILSINVLK